MKIWDILGYGDMGDDNNMDGILWRVKEHKEEGMMMMSSSLWNE
jgi:hypothetical protein